MTEIDFSRRFEALIDGRLSDGEAEAFLLALATRETDAADLVSAAQILRQHALPMTPLPNAIDLCGTGGDAAGTVNISTAAAFVTAACSVGVAKHGNRAASSQSGSGDVLHALGVAVASDAATALRHYDDFGLVFLNAPAFHPALVRLAPLRKRLARRTIFNLLGPLINPTGVERQLIGVYSPGLTVMMAEALHKLGSKAAWVVHGDGLDELTVTGASHGTSLQASALSPVSVDPVSLDMTRYGLADLRGGSPAQNAAALETMLQGSGGAYHDITVLNAGAALLIAGRVADLPAGLALARQAIDSGAALDLLGRMRQVRP